MSASLDSSSERWPSISWVSFFHVAVGGDDRLEVGALLGQAGEVLAAAHHRRVDQPLLEIDVAALDVCELVQHSA